jgi:hypothetical protein
VFVKQNDVPRRSAKKISENKIPRDPSGKWAKRVHELADRLGWYRVELWNLFDEVALLLEFEHRKRLSKPQSEDSAFRMISAMLDKAGSLAS